MSREAPDQQRTHASADNTVPGRVDTVDAAEAADAADAAAAVETAAADTAVSEDAVNTAGPGHAQLVQQLRRLNTEQRRQLREQLTHQQRAQPRAGQPVPPRPAACAPLTAHHAQRYPLSPAQSRLWLTQQMEGLHYKYNMVSAYHLHGDLDVAALRGALALISERHQTLRTYFRGHDENAEQIIAADFALALPLVDLSRHPAARRLACLREQLLEQARHCFDLSRGPLLYFRLYRLDEGHHVLLMNVHHAIFDGWSKSLLFRELSLAYRALRSGEQPQLPALKVQYGDYARWQRDHLGTLLQQQAAYWRTTLAGAPPLLELPTDYPRPSHMDASGDILPLRIEPALARQLQALGQHHGASLFMTLLAAFKLLLHRYSGARDVVVGTPVDLRNRPELRRLIGFFLNTVAVRTRLDPAMDFPALLAAVKQAALGAFQHQELPFENVVEAVNPPRSQSFAPLFQTLFVFQHASAGAPKLDGLRSEKIALGNNSTKYDLYLTFLEHDDGALSGWLSFRRDLFRRATMAAFLDSFQALLAGIAAQPQQGLQGFSLLDSGALATVREQARGGPQPLPALPTHRYFAQVAAQQPAAPALIDGDQQVTYQQLHQRGCQLARALARYGVVAGQCVGLYLTRGQDYVAALLAVWRLGAIALPLDLRQPAARLQAMVDTAQPVLILHAHQRAVALHGAATMTVAQALDQALERAQALDLTRTEAALDDHVADNGWIDTNWPAFLLFTSGSSGRPKGVLTSHRALLNRVHWQWQAHPLTPAADAMADSDLADIGLADTDLANTGMAAPGAAAIAAQRTSIGFVDAGAETWSALLAGVTLVVVDDEGARDPYELVDRLAHHRVSQVLLVPSLLRAVLEAYPELHRHCPHLRQVLLSGEALTPQLLARCREALPQAEIVNIYGATEAADVSAAAWPGATDQVVAVDVPQAVPDETNAAMNHAGDEAVPQAARVPIGRPLNNMQLYVLDEHLNHCAVGAVGQLYAHGPSLALGYWRQPGLSAQCFIPDPHAAQPGARMYRLGDWGRRRADGQIECLGRGDQQINLRGLRVECGEIEQVMERAPGVLNAVVLTVPRAAGDEALVAYVLVEEDARLDRPTLHQWLRQQLPDYMQPGLIQLCHELPYTAGGKVDRQQLRARGLPEIVDDFQAPRTPLEEQLAALWCEVLQVPRVAVNASFFELGGHSLLGVRVAARVRETLGLPLTVQALFQHATIAAVAQHLQSLQQVEKLRADDQAAAGDEMEVNEF